MGTPSGHVILRRGKRGAVWYGKYRLADGRQVKERLGPAWEQRGRPADGFFTKRTAEAHMREKLADVQRGLIRRPTVDKTFGEACASWLTYVEKDRGRAASTVSDYGGVVEGALKPEFGARTRLSTITSQRIDEYRRRLVDEGRLAPRTINKHLVILGGIFRLAQKTWDFPENPVASVERQVVHRTGDFDVLSSTEVHALARVAESETDAALFTTAAFSGLRLGELRALRWLDLDFSKRLIHVRRGYTRSTLGSTKSHRVRSVPMIDPVVGALDRLSRRERFTGSEDLVFANEVGSFIDDSRLRKRFKAALASAGLKSIRFHDLRHTFGTLAVQAFPLSDVKAYMGHADIQTTMIYVHHVPRRDAADKLSRLVADEATESSLGVGSPDARSSVVRGRSA